MHELKEHEQRFQLHPTGIKYICEHCNEGQMIVDPNESATMLASDPPQYIIPHVCDKCGAKLSLPKSYPYIEYLTTEEYLSVLPTMSNSDKGDVVIGGDLGAST